MTRISCEDISVCRGRTEVLSALTCTIEPATSTAIIGPNGAGKTTVLKAILGLLPLTSGRISFTTDGGTGTEGIERDLQELSYAQRAALMAYVPQHSMLQFPMQVRDVIVQGCYSSYGSQSWTKLPAAVRSAYQEIVEDLSITSLLTRSIQHLSGGERQRVLLARALLACSRDEQTRSSQILIVDEPTAHMDIAHVREMKRILRRLQTQGKTIIAVVHSIQDAADIADNALLLQAGTLYAQGSIPELIANGALEAVYGVPIAQTMQYGCAAT